ncbi:MAG: NfeD family protein [Planctomycetes bacterium]|nr:NfeD family protein [Planctomycetota bacterium]
MFGHLAIDKARLGDDARDAWRAAFCGTCHALRESGGRSLSLLTGRDVSLLTVVIAAIAPPAPIEGRACTALPFRTVGVQPLSRRARAYVAAIAVATVASKLEDDAQDGDRGLTRRIARHLLRGRGRNALAVLGELRFPVSLFAELPARQAAIERSSPRTVTAFADPSRELGGQVFAHAALAVGRPEFAAVLHDLGAALASWLYGWDAWFDREADRRRRRFNAWDAACVTDDKPIAAWLHAQLAPARASVLTLPSGGQKAVLVALLDSLAAKTVRIARDQRQAGDCDLGCCGDALCDASCAASDCDGCYVPCECCWWTDTSQRRRTLRRVRRATKRSEDLESVDLGALVGMTGTAVTDLMPDGRIELGRLAFDATADTGLIAAGQRVVVVAIGKSRLRVERARG